MGAHALPIIIFTALWGGVGIALPILVPKGPNRGYVSHNSIDPDQVDIHFKTPCFRIN